MASGSPAHRRLFLLAVPTPPPGPARRALEEFSKALSSSGRVELVRCGPSSDEADARALLTALQQRIAATSYDAVLAVDGPAARAVLGGLTDFACAVPVVVVSLPGFEPGPAPARRRPLSRPPAEAWCFGPRASSSRARELLPLKVHQAERPTSSWVRARAARLGAAPARPRSSTSIVIPCWNGLRYTRLCLSSVLSRTDGDFEVIVVDNGSTDGTAQFVRSRRDSRVSLIRNASNLGFAKAVNQGLRKAQGRYAVWLNNDAVVTEGWLGRLLAGLERAPWVGAVGPYTNEANGLQRLEPVRYRSLAELPAFAAAWAMEREGRLAWAHRLIGFCVAHRRSVLDEIGLLDERFGLGTYEDFDFCLRLRQAGYELFVAEDAYVHHHGHKSFEGNRVAHSDLLRRNREVFIDKWCRQSLAVLDEADALIAAGAPARRAAR